MNLFLLFLSELFLVVVCKPNVLFLIVDDLRPNLKIYGYENAVTPNLDKLAKKSFVFKNTFCQQALCAPSRNSLLTSRRPDSLHLYDFYSYWRKNVGNFTTIPQLFKENGYFTHSIGKVFHPGISSNFSDDMPYSWSTKPFHPKTEVFKNAKVCINKDGSLGKNLLCPVRISDQPGGTLPDLESMSSALHFLKYYSSSNESRPYFLAVGFHKPHIPFKFPVKYLDLHPFAKVKIPANHWRPSSLPPVAWNPWLDIRMRDDVMKLNVSFPFGRVPEFFMKRIIQYYDASVTYIDDMIGEILRKVESTNTIVIVTADHGWSTGEHGEYSKFSNFDVSTRVPLLIHVPHLSNREVIIDQLTELVDLFPTLVDLTQVAPSIPICDEKGINEKLCTEGKSMVPLMVNVIKNEFVKGKQAVFSQYPRPGVFPTKIPNSDEPRLKDIKIMGYSIRTETYRYTEWVYFNNSVCKPNWLQTFGKELYNHDIDLYENMNIIDRKELANVVRDLRKKLILGWRYI